jgi:hypothetical protein
LRALFGDQPHPGAQPDDNSPTALHPDAVRFPSRALSKAGLLPPTHIGERCELSTSDDTLIGASDATPTSDTMIATTQPLGPETVEETVVAWAPEPSWFERWPVRRAATITLAALGAGLAGAMTAFFTLGETEDVPPRPSIEVVEVPVMLEREDPPPVIPAPPAIEPEAIEDSPLPETADAQTDIDTDGASVEVASEATPKSSAPKRHRRPRHKKRTRAKTRTTKKKTDLDAMYPAGGRR